uniref:Uncharacterized protein n=1 Tax=Moorena producens (strain JHB) TaxID=1454205 RepID=A0A1D9FZB4_MOOP1
MFCCNQVFFIDSKGNREQGTGNRDFGAGSSDAEVRPVANLIRQRKAHLSGLGGSPHERLHQDGNREQTFSQLI